MAARINRSLRESKQYGDSAIIVLEMDTYGGEVDAAFQIVDTMVNVKNRTIAYVKTKAISAGALIALSCNELVMKHNTTIGDVAPLMLSQEGPKMLGEKYQSPIRAKFRTLAKRNGYSEILTEAMVTEGTGVYEVILPDTTLFLDSARLAELSPDIKKKIVSTKTVVKKGELLTMDDTEAKELGFSKMSVGSLDEMLDSMGYVNANIVRVRLTWSEALVRFLAIIAPVLIMIGLASLYIEYKTPGFGIPGIVGIICLGLVFFGQYMIGLADYTEMLLLILGIILLGVEIFVIPGFGIAGIAGISLIIIALILSMQDFVLPSPSMPWQMDMLLRNILVVIGSFIVAFICALLALRYVFPRISVKGQGPYLSATLENFHADSESVKQVNPGDQGIVVSPLRPSGKIRVGDQTYDVVTEGDFIERNANVVVIKISGNRIIVERKHDAA